MRCRCAICTSFKGAFFVVDPTIISGYALYFSGDALFVAGLAAFGGGPCKYFVGARHYCRAYDDVRLSTLMPKAGMAVAWWAATKLLLRMVVTIITLRQHDQPHFHTSSINLIDRTNHLHLIVNHAITCH